MTEPVGATTFADCGAVRSNTPRVAPFLVFERPDGEVAQWTYGEFDGPSRAPPAS